MGGWHFCTASCEMSKGKGSATSRAFCGAPQTAELLGQGGKEEEARVEPSSVLPGGGGACLLNCRQSYSGPGADPLWSTPSAGTWKEQGPSKRVPASHSPPSSSCRLFPPPPQPLVGSQLTPSYLGQCRTLCRAEGWRMARGREFSSVDFF